MEGVGEVAGEVAGAVDEADVGVGMGEVAEQVGRIDTAMANSRWSQWRKLCVRRGWEAGSQGQLRGYEGALRYHRLSPYATGTRPLLSQILVVSQFQ